MDKVCHVTGAALAMRQNHSALAALRGWSHAAQWQRRTRTALLPCIARLQFRVRVLQWQSIPCKRTASPHAFVKLLGLGIRPSGGGHANVDTSQQGFTFSNMTQGVHVYTAMLC